MAHPSSSDRDDGSRQRDWTKTSKALRHFAADRASDEKLMRRGFLRRTAHRLFTGEKTRPEEPEPAETLDEARSSYTDSAGETRPSEIGVDCPRGADFDALPRTGVGESRVFSVDGQFSGLSFVSDSKEHVLMQAKEKPAYLDALLERRQSSEYFSARELKERFHMMVIDTKELFKHILVPINGGQVSGHTQELKKRSHVTVGDAKGFFEHTPVPAIGDQSSGHAHELKKRFHVSVIDAKESFEHTPMLSIGQFFGHAHELMKRLHVTAIDAKEFFEHTPLLTFGQFSEDTHDLKKRFHVMVIGAKDFYEYTPGVLHANMKPAQLDALLKRRAEVRLIWDKGKSRALIIGGQLSGYFSANESKKRLYVTVAGAKGFFEYTPGVLHADIAAFFQRSRQPFEVLENQYKSHSQGIIGTLQPLDQFTEHIM